MEYKGYIGKVEFDDEAGLFHGEIINLRDVITYEGTSVQELRQAFQESIEDYLAFCAERGETPEKPFSGTLKINACNSMEAVLSCINDSVIPHGRDGRYIQWQKYASSSAHLFAITMARDGA